MQQKQILSKTLYLSYAEQDSAFSFQLTASLKNAGFDVWAEQIDAVHGNENHQALLQSALSRYAVVLPVISDGFIRTQNTWLELEQLTIAAPTRVIPVLLYAWDWPDWVYHEQMLDFSRWRNTFIYNRCLEQLVALLKEHLPQSPPDTEIRYVNQTIAGVERYKDFLRKINSRDNRLPSDKRAIYARSLWGLTGGFTVTKEGSATIHPFGEVMRAHPRFILVGDSGAGKTITLRRTLLDTLRAYQVSPEEFPLPVMLSLGRWVKPTSFEAFLRENWPLDSDPASALAEGHVLLLLDGLDETGSLQAGRTASLHNWLHSETSPQYVIITCDAQDYTESALDLPVVSLKPLDTSRIRQHISHYLDDDPARHLLSQILEDDSRHLAKTASSAFYLAILVAITQHTPDEMLPGHEALLLKWLVEKLWETLPTSQKTVSIEIALPALSSLAFSMIDDNQPTFVTNEYALGKIGEEPILQQALDSGVMQMQDGFFAFSHRLIQDYCATYWLMVEEGVYTRLTRTQFTSDGRRIPQKWDRVIQFCSALSPDVDSFISIIAETDPYLALKCIDGGIVVSEKIQRHIAQHLLAFIQTAKPYKPKVIQLIQHLAEEEPLAILLEYLHHETPTYTHTQNGKDTAMPLMKLGTDTIRLLISILKGETWSRRRGAAWALGEIQEPAAVPSLIEALQDTDEGVRKEADYALARIGTPALPRLLKTLQSKDPDIRAAVIKVLGRIGDARAVPDIVACLPDTSWPRTEDVRVCDLAAIALEHIGTDEALSALDTWRESVRLAESQSEWVKRIRPKPQTDIQRKKPLDELIKDLNHSEWRIRRDSVEALGETGDPAILPHLLRALKDNDSQVRWIATQMLCKFQEAEATNGLLEALRDEDHLTSDVAQAHLIQIGEPAVAGLSSALSDASPNVRGKAADALGKIRSEAAIPYLVDVLTDTAMPELLESGRVCDIAAAALGHIGTKQAMLALARWRGEQPAATPSDEAQPLIVFEYAADKAQYSKLISFLDALQSGDWKDRRKAMVSLQEYAKTLKGESDSEIVRKLSQALNDEESLVRWTATETLAILGSKTAIPALLEAMRDASWTVRAAAVRALLELETEDIVEAVPGLLDALNDKSPLVREAAVAVLGKAADHSTIQHLAHRLTIDEDSFVRRTAALALAAFTGDSAASPLILAVEDPEENVRRAAIESLGKIHASSAVPILVNKLQDTSKPAWEDRKTCDIAAEALETIGTPDAIESVKRWREQTLHVK